MGASYNGPIFDSDTHLHEVGDAFVRYLPAKYRDRWKLEWRMSTDNEWTLHVGDRKVEVLAGYYTEDGRVPPPGRLKEWLKAMKMGKAEVDLRVPMTPDMYNRDARIAKMDEFGVEACLLFCGGLISTISYLDEIEPRYATFNAYNRWLQEEWGFAYKDRIFAAPVVTLEDLDLAIEQAEFVVRNGARHVMMPMGPYNRKAPADPVHDRFWAILNEAGVRASFHVGEALYMKDHMENWGEKVQQSRLRQTAFIWMHGYSERPLVETLSSFIFYNFFERFPNMKLISVENGAEWAPAMLTKMDKVRGMARGGYWPGGQLKHRPSDIFKEYVRVVAFPEDDVKNIIDLTGSSEYLLMGSDYPHSEGVESPKKFMDEALQGVVPSDVKAIMYDNGRALIPA
jgi:predicted TIM-barrel fold metal-dependent hydrolase